MCAIRAGEGTKMQSRKIKGPGQWFGTDRGCMYANQEAFHRNCRLRKSRSTKPHGWRGLQRRHPDLRGAQGQDRHCALQQRPRVLRHARSPTSCSCNWRRLSTALPASEHMIAVAEKRRDAIVREIDNRRTTLAQAVRRTVEQIEHNDYQVLGDGSPLRDRPQ